MPATVQLDLSQLAAHFEAQGKSLANVSLLKPLRVIRQLVVRDIEQNFNQSHAPDGTPWLPLRFARPNSQGADKPLYSRGFLLASAVGSGVGHIEEITGNSLTIASTLPQAAVHQYGATITAKNGKMLAIPLSAEASNYTGPRGGSNPFPRQLDLVARPGHAPLLVEHQDAKGKKGERMEAHYILVPQVTIPARPFLGIGPQTMRQIGVVLAEHSAQRLTGGEE